MLKELPKFSITIITYNQEHLIKRAIDSILIQKEWVYEIIICDDCSTDNNWQVILDYKNRYPNLIKAFRNERNLGIFGNIETTWTKTSGDAVLSMAGDDELCYGIFKKACELIEIKHIDYSNEDFCLYFDYKIVYPTKRMNFWGKFAGNVITNKLICKGLDPIVLKIRGLIVNRTVIFSNKIQKKFLSVPKNIGIFADGLVDIQIQQNTKQYYYSPFVGSIYYAKIGISAKTSIKEAAISRRKLHEAYKALFELSKKDIAWLDFIDERSSFYIKPSFIKFIKTFYYYFSSIELKYGIKGLQIKLLLVDIWKFISNIKNKLC